MDGGVEFEQALSEFFRDFGVSFVAAGWRLAEVDAAVRFMRGRMARGISLADALIAVFELQAAGKLLWDPEC